MKPRRDPTVPILVAIVFLAPGVALLRAPLAIPSNEWQAKEALKSIALAQANFRANDLDGDKIQNFWTGDVAGLYYLPGRKDGSPLRLIDRRVADADASPIPRHSRKPMPYYGYFFVAMEMDESADPPEPFKRDGGYPSYGRYYNTSIFGFAAYPAKYGRTGTLSFILNESNTLFKVDTGGRPPRNWPLEFRQKREWGSPD